MCIADTLNTLATLLQQENVPFLQSHDPETEKDVVHYYASTVLTGKPHCTIREENGMLHASGPLSALLDPPLTAEDIALKLCRHWEQEVAKLCPSRQEWDKDYNKAKLQYETYMKTRYGHRTSRAGTYQEIRLLHALLDEAGIPHTFKPHHFGSGYQILYTDQSPEEQSNSVIQNEISFGHEYDLLEARGKQVADNDDGDTRGCLTAREIFRRIRADWLKSK